MKIFILALILSFSIGLNSAKASINNKQNVTFNPVTNPITKLTKYDSPQKLLAVGQFSDSSNDSPLIYLSYDSGKSWSKHVVAEKNSYLESVSCAGDKNQYCTAVGIVNGDKPLTCTSTDGGENWTPHVLSQSNIMFTDIQCSNFHGQYCIATGLIKLDPQTQAPGVFISIDAGITWSIEKLPSKGDNPITLRLSCKGENDQYCTIIGRETLTDSSKTTYSSPLVYTTNNGGVSWLEQTLPIFDTHVFIKSISCLGEQGQLCKIAGNYSNSSNSTISAPIVFNYDGTQWIPDILPTIEGYVYEINDMSCVNNNQYCAMIGDYGVSGHSGANMVYSTTDSGLNWSFTDLKEFDPNDVLRSVSCSGDQGQFCVIAGSWWNAKPIFYISVDGGSNWERHDFGNDSGFLTKIITLEE